MRKLPQVSGTAAAVLAAVITAGAFTCRPAAGPAHAPADGPATASLGTSRPGVIRPGGPAVLTRGQHRPGRPGMETADLISLNWGGFAASRPRARFRYIQSVFYVPYVDCASTPDAQSAHWVGLDGLHNNTVEQTGISADCHGDRPSYRAWYEMVPDPPAFPRITIRPGDAIVASVYYSRRSGRFTLSLTDATNRHHFSRSAACPARVTCPRTAAEAISEPPLGPRGYLPLANFRAEGYSAIQVTDQAGHRGGLRSSWWDTTKITTVNFRGETLDQPTALHAGRTFGTYWMRED